MNHGKQAVAHDRRRLELWQLVGDDRLPHDMCDELRRRSVDFHGDMTRQGSFRGARPAGRLPASWRLEKRYSLCERRSRTVAGVSLDSGVHRVPRDSCSERAVGLIPERQGLAGGVEGEVRMVC